MPRNRKHPSPVPRRDFLKMSAATVGAIGTSSVAPAVEAAGRQSAARPVAGGGRRPRPARAARPGATACSAGERLNRVAFPMGGMGAGMICLEGTGALSHVSLRHKPEVFNEPLTFAALCVKGKTNIARVLEGPVPDWKMFGAPGTGNGALRHVVRTAAVSPGDVPRAVSVRRRHARGSGCAARRSRSPAGARSSPATRTTPACPWRRWSIASPIRPAGRSRRCSPGTRRTSWPSARIRRR